MLLVRWVFLVLFLLPGCAAQQSPRRSLTILHLNDLHARLLPDSQHRGGFAHVAEAIRQEKGVVEEVVPQMTLAAIRGVAPPNSNYRKEILDFLKSLG